jgi:hypothetical protein
MSMIFLVILERAKGFEPSTPTLARSLFALRHTIRLLARSRLILETQAPNTDTYARTPYPTTASHPISSAYKVLTL